MKQKWIKTTVLGLALACILAVPAFADTVGGGTVTATALNLRAEPTVASARRQLIPGGAFVLVEENLGGWYKVCYNGSSGYVAAEYLDFSDTMDGWYGYGAEVTGDYVRLRAGASTSSAILGSYNRGAGMQVLGVSDNWVKVSSGWQTGYIRSDYLRYTSGGTGNSTAAQGTGAQLVESAKQYLGVPYVWGGMSEYGFDCSGFVNYVYKLYGYSMNRVAQSIYSNDGSYVEKSALEQGDLVFFGYSGSSITHVGMYIGDGQFIHASSGSGKVVITDLSSSYYTRMYVGAKRIL